MRQLLNKWQFLNKKCVKKTLQIQEPDLRSGRKQPKEVDNDDDNDDLLKWMKTIFMGSL